MHDTGVEGVVLEWNVNIGDFSGQENLGGLEFCV
jgi:hypothetical protein